MPDLIGELAARDLRQAIDESSASSLPFATARLYSQHVRLRAGRTKLVSWRTAELEEHLGSVVALLDAADAGTSPEHERQSAYRRAAELLEWLNHPTLNPAALPLDLLSAACYQLAGFPARAGTLARSARGPENDAPLLRLLLVADFPRLLIEAADAAYLGRHSDPRAIRETVDDWYQIVATEIAGALGVLAAELRWGGESRRDTALRKLEACAKAFRRVGQPMPWLLTKLSSDVARLMAHNDLRAHLASVESWSTEAGHAALEAYARQRFLDRRTLAWPSQIRGLQRLASGGSFALCTPTGSGKTTVAEVALLDGLFRPLGDPDLEPLCLYIVPTRALAAEVESKLSAALRRVAGARPLTVTGLYGGTDWGPSDGVLSADEPTVLICTPEKAEALLRFLGWAIIGRLALVIVDEAHEVSTAPLVSDLRVGDSRSLRLEMLVARLKSLRDQRATRFIAMSAVAEAIERPLAQWMADGDQGTPVRSEYRSTRQAVGRLRCSRSRTQIQYDVLDGRPLTLTGSDLAPYVPRPFSNVPACTGFEGPQKSLAPYALWAAINLATSTADSPGQSVLISVASQVRNWAGWAEELLNQWDEDVPAFASHPEDESTLARLNAALSACDDYFGENSLEARLLRRGIVVHYGRMPGRLPRLLVQLIEERAVKVVLATSGLSQGVNLPFETVLVPLLRRQNQPMERDEFWNLVGRAGRPGVATEGQTLVLFNEDEPAAWRRTQLRNDYANLTGQAPSTGEDGGARPLADLLELLRAEVAVSTDEEFVSWLETTATLTEAESDPVLTLDTLDGILIAVLEEAQAFGSAADAEAALRRLWRSSFSRYAVAEEERLQRIIVQRGEVVRRTYSNDPRRTSIYRSSLPPRSAVRLDAIATEFRVHLARGGDYARWSAAERLEYVLSAITILAQHPKFAPRATVGRTRATWMDVLTWWLQGWGAPAVPSASQVGPWHDFISTHFTYKFTWALGSALSVIAADPANEAPINLRDWSATGLPWISVWLKDLIEWGTLDPVAAYLMSRGGYTTRPEAEAAAIAYYPRAASEPDQDPLDPEAIRQWVMNLTRQRSGQGARSVPAVINASLFDGFPEAALGHTWKVVPAVHGRRIQWLDPSGRLLATSTQTRTAWPDDWAEAVDFALEPSSATVRTSSYE